MITASIQSTATIANLAGATTISAFRRASNGIHSSSAIEFIVDIAQATELINAGWSAQTNHHTNDIYVVQLFSPRR